MIPFTEAFREAWNNFESLYEAITDPTDLLKDPENNIINQLKAQPYLDDSGNEQTNLEWYDLNNIPKTWAGICGIYCISHKYTFQRYYGLAVDIYSRVTQHKLSKSNEQDSAFHKFIAGHIADFKVAIVKTIEVQLTVEESSNIPEFQISLNRVQADCAKLSWVNELTSAEKAFIDKNNTYRNIYHLNNSSGGEFGSSYSLYTGVLRAVYLLFNLVENSAQYFSYRALANFTATSKCKIDEKVLAKYDFIFMDLSYDLKQYLGASKFNSNARSSFEHTVKDILGVLVTEAETLEEIYNFEPTFFKSVDKIERVITKTLSALEIHTPLSPFGRYYKEVAERKDSMNLLGDRSIYRNYIIGCDSFKQLEAFYNFDNKDNQLIVLKSSLDGNKQTYTTLIDVKDPSHTVTGNTLYTFSTEELDALYKGITIYDYFQQIQNTKSGLSNEIVGIPGFSLKHLVLLVNAAFKKTWIKLVVDNDKLLVQDFGYKTATEPVSEWIINNDSSENYILRLSDESFFNQVLLTMKKRAAKNQPGIYRRLRD